tara:strand:- start:539 stop:946 length:408 start_codon:yes stop_codon:yes gene_type:complete
MSNDYAQFLAQKEEVKSVKQARVRVGVSWLLHMFTIPPVVSLVYSIKTENYVPVLAATGAAILSAPVAMIDFGLTFFVAPPITSAVLIQTKAGERRRQLGIFGPEQADSMYFSNFQNRPQYEVVVKNETKEAPAA